MRTDDGYIIQQCLEGKASAFGLLVDKYKRSIYALAYSEVRNFHDAQDITQEVFIKVYRNLHTLKRWDSFMGWLYRITINVCKNWVRTESRRLDTDFVEDQDISIIDDPSIESYRQDSMYESVRDSIDSLPEVYRQVLTLRYYGGMSIKEMCNFLGVSHATIERRLRDAQARMKEEILTMIQTDSKQYELPSSFTFRIVEMIKGIRINPVPPIKALPWGLSLATGLIIAVLGIGTHISPIETIGSFINSSGESKVLDVGEFPVDVVKVSDISVMSNGQMNGDGLGSIVPSLQNAFSMAPQAGDTWTKKADMPTARHVHSACVVNGKIYAIGGFTINQLENSYARTVEEYDPTTDKWTRKSDIPTPRGALSSCVVDGKIYAIGGDEGPDWASPVVEEYDPIADKWTKKADMPTGRSGLSTCAVNGKIYAIGGGRRDHLNGKITNFPTVEEYNPKTNTWTQKTDMPTGRSFWSSCADLVDGKIYVIGGGVGDNNGTKMLSSVEQYDPIADKWTKKANMPTAREASTAAVNGRIYAIGGFGGENKSYLTTVEEYDPITDSWNKKNDMPTARASLSTCAVNGKIYAIGGNVGIITAISIPIVEEYDTGFSGEGVNFKGKLPTTWGETKTALNR
jgi:RNA polymerase sigma factor (sigma-70 family)